MSREKVELVRRIYSNGLFDRDPDRIVHEFATPDIEYTMPEVEPGLFGVGADQVGVAETPRPESALDAWRVRLVRCRAFSGAEARSGG
jgi:hypothetical protein